MNESIQETLADKPAANTNGKGAARDLEDLNRQSQRIQQLVEELTSLPDIETRTKMQECIQEIIGFYGKGIERMLEIVSKNKDAAGAEVYNGLLQDSFVSGLLLIHDLHPIDLETRMNQALEKLRPYMDSHGGSVEIVSLENNFAKLRLNGSCKGCPSSSITLELGLKKSIEEHCPDLLGLEIEGATSSNKNGHQNGNTSQTVSGWKILQGISQLKPGAMAATESSGIPLIICKVKEQLYAYRNQCPACDLPLNTGKLEENILSCKLGHRYDLQQAGRCADNPELHLNPFPLLQENGVVKVAVA